MSTIETIRAKMVEVGSQHTLDETPALRALRESRLIQYLLAEGYFSAQTLPIPPISRPFQAQLTILWREYARTEGAERQALRGAFDRIVAELYGLTVDDLVTLEQHLS